MIRGGKGAETTPRSFIGYGAVQDSNGRTTDQVGYDNHGTVTGIQQMYIAEVQAGVVQGQVVQASSLNPTFPADSLSLAVIVVDEVQRVQQAIDVRPSYLSAAPNLGSGMTEYVPDATRRVYFQNNYAVPRTYSLSPLIPPDLSLPTSGFVLGAGSVVISGKIITTPSTCFTATTKVNNPNPIYAFYGSLAQGTTQGYIDPTTGAIATRQGQTSGAFPANCLPIFEATVATGLIRSLVDWRPSYLS